MTTRWLLAAEADKIQDFVFRSSRLVEVAGGSGLLARFCEDTPAPLMTAHAGRTVAANDPDIVIAAGGGFRLIFGDQQAAEATGRSLAEEYYRSIGGTLTVAAPQPFDLSATAGSLRFSAAAEAAEGALRQAKRDRRGGVAAVAHVPYAAFCASCGVALATMHVARHDERATYRCQSCADRASEWDRHSSTERFLGRFLTAVGDPEASDIAKRKGTTEPLPRDADAVAEIDPRRNVAYLVADGNDMGPLFGKASNPVSLHELSRALTDSMWGGLAEATRAVIQRLDRDAVGARRPRVPVTPLIVGGDDLFALVPAPYAIDFAQRVCRAFEAGLRQAAAATETAWMPTMTAAVVICKKGYPYALAHREGERLLRNAKRLVRAARVKDGLVLSAVTFTVIRGSDVGLDDDTDRARLLRTARPYWVTGREVTPEESRYALDVSSLLSARLRLNALPGKRRAELRELFTGDLPADANTSDRIALLRALDDVWATKRDALLRRIGRRGSRRADVEAVFEDLGDADLARPSRWRCFEGRSQEPFAHGLPDLLEVWDVARNLDEPAARYEGEA